MTILLDTHAFLWWDQEPNRLSPPALAALLGPSNTVLLGVVSVWETLIKLQIGKLTSRRPLAEIVTRQRANGLTILTVTLEHTLRVETLPAVHKDPFDRLLIAQAIVEGASLMSSVTTVARYPVSLLW